MSQSNTKKWTMIVDIEKCHNCNNCFISAKDEHVGNAFPGYSEEQPLHGHRWIDIKRKERGQAPMAEANFMPVMCNHCDAAPCLRKDGAVYKRADGIVIIDPDKAKGKKEIASSCPYGHIWWNEEKQLAQKWTFDAHLLDSGWDKPRCVQVCPTGALQSKKVNDRELKELINVEALEEPRPELRTQSRVYYKNLHLIKSWFLGASVTASVDGIEECLADATVVLYKSGEKIAETTTDAFGEFKFDKLRDQKALYTLLIKSDSLPTKRIEVELDGSRYLGTISMDTTPRPSAAVRPPENAEC